MAMLSESFSSLYAFLAKNTISILAKSSCTCTLVRAWCHARVFGGWLFRMSAIKTAMHVKDFSMCLWLVNGSSCNNLTFAVTHYCSTFNKSLNCTKGLHLCSMFTAGYLHYHTAEMVVIEPIMGVVFCSLVCIWVDTVHFCRWVWWWLGGEGRWVWLTWFGVEEGEEEHCCLRGASHMIRSLSMRCSMTFLAWRTRRLRRETNMYNFLYARN